MESKSKLWFSTFQGVTPAEIIGQQKTVVEGYWATACFFEKCQKIGVDMPILSEIYNILYNSKEPLLAIIRFNG